MLADAGASVIIGYNQGEDRARALMAKLPGSGHGIQQLALEDSASVVRAGEAIAAKFPTLNVLVNSAGFTKPIPHDQLDALDDAFMDTMLITNVRGPFSVIRALAPALKASGDGVIVNVSSVSAFTGAGSSIAYVASKAAIDGISMALARALGPVQGVVIETAPCKAGTEVTVELKITRLWLPGEFKGYNIFKVGGCDLSGEE